MLIYQRSDLGLLQEGVGVSLTARDRPQVSQEENIGSWLNSQYDHDLMSNMLQRVVFDRPPHHEARPLPLNLVPNGTVNDFWLNLDVFSYAPTAKHQCYSFGYGVKT